jgi:hypothetical protein
MAPGGTRKGPYIQFDNPRLAQLSVVYPKNKAAGAAFLVYLDPYRGQPYAYFSTGKTANNYLYYSSMDKLSDCSSLNSNLAGPPPAPFPYQQTPSGTTPVQFYKPDTFQIISAGKDLAFGPGGYWVPSLGAGGMNTATPSAAKGVDDITNFYDSKLGTKQ